METALPIAAAGAIVLAIPSPVAAKPDFVTGNEQIYTSAIMAPGSQAGIKPIAVGAGSSIEQVPATISSSVTEAPNYYVPKT